VNVLLDKKSEDYDMAGSASRLIFPGNYFRNIIVLLVLVLIYFLAGKLGLMLAFVHPSATAVWPPTGIALAAFLLLGFRIWPAILAGAFLVNITTCGTLATSMGIAAGNTLEGVVGAFLLTRYVGGKQAFNRPQDVFKFAILAGVLSTMVSATFGVTSLCLGGFAPWTKYASIWLTWWLGDAVGDWIVAPVLILWALNPYLHWNRKRAAETTLLFLSLLIAGLVVFSGLFSSGLKNYPLEFLCIPFLMWAAFRFGRRETATASCLLSGIAIWGTLQGFGPFALKSSNESLLVLQLFMGVITIMAIALASIVAERRKVEKALRQSEERYALAVQGSNDGLWDWNLQTEKVHFSLLWKQLLGYTEDEIGEDISEWFTRVHPEDIGILKSLMDSHLKGESFHFVSEYRILQKDGTYHWMLSRGVATRDDAGNAYRIAGSQTDIQTRKRVEEELLRQATSDPLTNLPNRVFFLNRLVQASNERRKNKGRFLAVLFVDLDHFKLVNDRLGHLAGDELLIEITQRLKGCLRPEDTIARVGGDEFTILLDDVKDIRDAIRAAERIQKHLALPFFMNGQEIQTTASIGISLSEKAESDPEKLLQEADKAMYRAKTLGRARFEVFDSASYS
jgi:diguanylate cyclase (GGDEF)-like protein/PAS domain S-box-containing protein